MQGIEEEDEEEKRSRQQAEAGWWNRWQERAGIAVAVVGDANLWRLVTFATMMTTIWTAAIFLVAPIIPIVATVLAGLSIIFGTVQISKENREKKKTIQEKTFLQQVSKSGSFLSSQLSASPILKKSLSQFLSVNIVSREKVRSVAGKKIKGFWITFFDSLPKFVKSGGLVLVALATSAAFLSILSPVITIASLLISLYVQRKDDNRQNKQLNTIKEYNNMIKNEYGISKSKSPEELANLAEDLRMEEEAFRLMQGDKKFKAIAGKGISANETIIGDIFQGYLEQVKNSKGYKRKHIYSNSKMASAFEALAPAVYSKIGLENHYKEAETLIKQEREANIKRAKPKPVGKKMW